MAVLIMDKNLSALEVVSRARSDSKITGIEIINNIFDDFMELHGDRLSGDDPAIVGGIALFRSQPVTVITTNRGNDTVEKIKTHFGSAMPTGYRKSLRLIKQAAKFNRPVFCFVNTAGAFPSKDAEEGGQGAAIAQNILQLSSLPIPIITVIYGEGGSGGALALACGDEVWMLENSTYSILSPEGFASIMWKNSDRADEAAELMQMTPPKLLEKKVIEGIIPESDNHVQTCQKIGQILDQHLKLLQGLSSEQLIQRRMARYRKF